MSNYSIETLETVDRLTNDPFELFHHWLDDAQKNEPRDHNAMSLATIDENGRPSVRIVLLKQHDTRGFVFFTNKESRKGLALAANNRAALCFHWKSLNRQIRIEGITEEISEEESIAYYNSRHRGSRIGAWASLQSRPLQSRTELKERVQNFEEKYEGTEIIQKPPHWGGYRVIPDNIEFWDDGKFRLHTRVLYKYNNKTWDKTMLYP